MKQSVAGVIKKNDLYFVARRLPGGAMGNKWEFPGGKVEEGETCEKALLREFEEEFSVSVSIGDKICSVLFSNEGHEFFLSAYHLQFKNENYSLNEHSEVKWMSLSDIHMLDFADSDKKILPFLN